MIRYLSILRLFTWSFVLSFLSSIGIFPFPLASSVSLSPLYCIATPSRSFTPRHGLFHSFSFTPEENWSNLSVSAQNRCVFLTISPLFDCPLHYHCQCYLGCLPTAEHGTLGVTPSLAHLATFSPRLNLPRCLGNPLSKGTVCAVTNRQPQTALFNKTTGYYFKL